MPTSAIRELISLKGRSQKVKDFATKLEMVEGAVEIRMNKKLHLFTKNKHDR